MKITNDTPFVIPPTEPKTYPDLWIYGLTVLCPSASSGRVEITTLPYNYDTQEIYSGGHVTISTDDLWKAVQEVPEVQMAFGAILQSVEPLKAWIAKNSSVENII
jgi:hypothetical protein